MHYYSEYALRALHRRHGNGFHPSCEGAAEVDLYATRDGALTCIWCQKLRAIDCKRLPGGAAAQAEPIATPAIITESLVSAKAKWGARYKQAPTLLVFCSPVFRRSAIQSG